MYNYKNIIQDFYRLDYKDQLAELARLYRERKVYTCFDLEDRMLWSRDNCCDICHNQLLDRGRLPMEYYNGEILVRCCCEVDRALSAGDIDIHVLY